MRIAYPVVWSYATIRILLSRAFSTVLYLGALKALESLWLRFDMCQHIDTATDCNTLQWSAAHWCSTRSKHGPAISSCAAAWFKDFSLTSSWERQRRAKIDGGGQRERERAGMIATHSYFVLARGGLFGFFRKPMMRDSEGQTGGVGVFSNKAGGLVALPKSSWTRANELLWICGYFGRSTLPLPREKQAREQDSLAPSLKYIFALSLALSLAGSPSYFTTLHLSLSLLPILSLTRVWLTSFHLIVLARKTSVDKNVTHTRDSCHAHSRLLLLVRIRVQLETVIIIQMQCSVSESKIFKNFLEHVYHWRNSKE